MAQGLAEATSWWWSEERQRTLDRMMEQLAMKKKSAALKPCVRYSLSRGSINSQGITFRMAAQ